MTRQPNKPEYYAGSTNPTPDMRRRAQEFFDRAVDMNSQRSDLPPLKFRYARKNVGGKLVDPAKTKDGMGKLWLDCFRDFDGSKCLIFPFTTASQPRGSVTYNFKRMPAHRAMCLMAHGLPKEEGKTMALHRCGNGHLGCVNPKHLYWGDQSDNNKDAHRHTKEGRAEAA